MKYIGIDIKNKDTKGIYLFCDTNLKHIESNTQANRIIDDDFKLQLQVRVNGKRTKKTFTFTKGVKKVSTFIQSKKTFLKALEYVAGKREEVRATLKENGTLKEQKEVIEDVAVPKHKDTFFDRMNYFLETKSISARPSTIQNYTTALKTHCKPLHDKNIDEITIAEVQALINDMLTKRASATVVLYARTLGTFFKKQKVSISKEWDELELPEVDNRVDYTLGLNDTKKIIVAMRNYSGTLVDGKMFYSFEEIRNIFTFLLTGRRINEVLELKYTDINFEAKTFTIPATTAKGKKELVFNIDDNLLEAIQSQARLQNIDLNKPLINKRLFKYTKETPRVHFQGLVQALGLPKLRLHDIRHMIATTLVQNKVPIQDISVMLGHSSIAITEARYASKSKDQASRATDALNDIVGGV